MKFAKAVITAAGPNQRSLPLQSLVDRDGLEKPALAIILEEARSAGIEEACVVVHQGDSSRYSQALAETEIDLTFVEQTGGRGYGHALHCGRDFVGDAPFLHLVSDHLYVSHGHRTCAEELIAVAERERAAVSAVQQTRENKLPYYGVVAGQRDSHGADVYKVQQVVEKPTPTQAEQTLVTPGLRAGHYLGFYGMHALTPVVFETLADEVGRADGDISVGLSPALNQLAGRQRYLAFEVPGQRYNIGVKYGLLNAQIALAMAGVDKDEVLTQLLELLAARELDSGSATA